MTPEEIVCELFIRQGYLIMESSRELKLGEIHVERSETFAGDLLIPTRIIGPATREEFQAQCRLAFEIVRDMEPYDDPIHFPVSYFYRVEAID